MYNEHRKHIEGGTGPGYMVEHWLVIQFKLNVIPTYYALAIM